MPALNAYLHARTGQQHQLDAMRACRDGLTRHGINSHIGDTEAHADSADFVVWWGDRVPQWCDKPKLILEAGYINGQSGDYVRDRLRFVSTGWGGLHGRADRAPSDCPPDRWQALGVEMPQWRTGGRHALVCGQHPGDLCAPTPEVWRSLSERIIEQHDMTILRPHPLMAGIMQPLEQALHDAHSCYTWNSTCAVESVLMGVPTWAFDQGSMAWDVCAHDVDAEAFTGDRAQWAYNLAYRQWTHDELASGEMWEHMNYGG
jgi:hypothetical protein